MKGNYITSRQLGKRWKMHPGSIANMRCQGKGPRATRKGRRISYKLTTVENFEDNARARGKWLGV